MTLSLRTNLTCGSNECVRHDREDVKSSFRLFEKQENDIRTAMRYSRKVSTRYDNSPIRIVYFNGRKGDVMEICRESTVSSIRDKLTLCSKFLMRNYS